MRIVIDHDGTDREVDLAINDADATVAALVAAAAPGEAPGLVVLDGRCFEPGVRLDELGLYEGARLLVRSVSQPVEDSRATGEPRRLAAGPALAVAGGLAAGGHHPVGTGVVVGRDAACGVRLDDPTVSARHARVWPDSSGELFVEDLGSRNGTWVDGVAVTAVARLDDGALLRLGATELRFRAALPDDRPRRAGLTGRADGHRITFNRPPRAARPSRPADVVVPEPAPGRETPRALNIAAIAAPLLLGAVFVLMYREPRFALFMLLSPVMALATWASSRRRARRQRRGDARAFRRAVEDFDRALVDAVAAECERREARLPDLAEVVRRGTAPSTRLWERRGGDDDVLHLRVGTADVPWQPGLTGAAPVLDDAVAARIEAAGLLPRCPAEVDLTSGTLGLVGDRAAATALARALVLQLAVHHGPADVSLAVFAAPEARTLWSWTAWLPHVRDQSDRPRLAFGAPAADELARQLSPSPAPERPQPSQRPLIDSQATACLVAVVDDAALLERRGSPLRRLLQAGEAPCVGIVLAATADELPALTDTVVELRGTFGDGALTRPGGGLQLRDVVVAGVSSDAARDVARILARYDDPELLATGGRLPPCVRLPPLLDFEAITPDEVEARWAESRLRPRLMAPLGVSADGPLWVDLVGDGPHVLVGGTTGSGKSELLRSLVAGLAAGHDPDHVVFVLVDYKGGSAFDACSGLPHCVGLVTDLDAHLGERALRSLEAELRHRERVLRQAGVEDLHAYRAAGAPAGALPRLVVVVDEFATLAVELPDFLGALVGVAQRGRSLGMHLVLATQRPTGVVSSSITANTNLRIALRVQDVTDSTDVVDRPDAAGIPRDLPGRAYVRLGHHDVIGIQTPLATGYATKEGGPVRIRPLVDGVITSDPASPAEPPTGPNDLDRLVAAISEAQRRRDGPAPRRPWLEMLPETLAFADLQVAAAADELVFALADDPDGQRRLGVGWRPDEGHLLLCGSSGAGKTTALRALARAVVQTHDPDTCHLYAIDAASGGLQELEALAHCAAVTTARDAERRLRVLRRLRDEIDHRRAGGAATPPHAPRVVLLVDGVSTLLADLDEPDAAEADDAFRRILADGPAVGVAAALTCDRPGALPMRLAALVSQRLLLRLGDKGDYAAAGLRPRDVPAFTPGRAVRGEDGLVCQVAAAGPLEAWPLTNGSRCAGGPPSIECLPAVVPAAALAAAKPRRPSGSDQPLDTDAVDGTHGSSLGPQGLRVAVGIADADLGPAELVLGPGAHALVAGPPASGKSSALMLLAQQVRAGDPGAILVGICGSRSPLQECADLDAVGTPGPLDGVLAASVDDQRRWVVLVDDAVDVRDDAGRLASLLRSGRPGAHVIVAGRSDDLQRSYSHWSRPVRQSRTGILLQPDLSTDGELLSVRLPRRVPLPFVPGRGYVVIPSGIALTQVATPGTRPSA